MSMKLDAAFSQFLATPVRLPELENIGDAERLIAEGRKHVKDLIKKAICNGVLPPGIKFLQCVHVRPGHVDLGSPLAVHRDHHQQIVSANLLRAHQVQPKNSFFFEVMQNKGLPHGAVALISKDRAVKKLRGTSEPPFIKVWFDKPLAPDVKKLTGYSEKPLCDGWHWIDNLEELLRVNHGWLSAYASEPDHWELSVPTGINISDEFIKASIAPLVACGHVLLCAPAIYASDSKDPLGGGGCMFVLERLPDVHLIRRLFLVSQKLISTISTYQDFVRSASASGANAAIRMITHSFGNAVNYIPESSPKALHVLQAEEVVVRAAGLLLSEDQSENTNERNRRPFGQQLIRDASCKGGEVLEIQTDLDGKKIDCRLFALLLEVARNCVEHSADSPKSGTLRFFSPNGNPCIVGSNQCTYIPVRDLKKKLEHINASIVLVKGFDFVIWLARALATSETKILVKITRAAARSDNEGFVVLATRFREMPIELAIDEYVMRLLPKLEADGDVSEKFRISFEIKNLSPAAIL